MNEQLLKYFAGELSNDKQSELLKRVENDEELKMQFIRFQNINAISELLPHSMDRDDGLKNFELFTLRDKLKTRKIRILNTLKYTAVAVFIIASTVWGTLFFNDTGLDSTLNTLYVPAGQRAKITLQDGTEVWLNAQSTLKYPAHFSKKNRYVELSGEAFFDIVENSKKPFVVSTQDMEMKVLGTQFNVHSYSSTNYIKTDLVEGSLVIYSKNAPEKRVLLKPNEQMIKKGDNVSIGEIKNSDYFLWKDGIYTFENERLLDIIEKLQLYYDVKIIVNDPEIFNVHYTGKFRQRDGIDEILRIIQTIQKFTIEKNYNTNTITLTK